MTRDLGWYARRLAQMSPGEVSGRLADKVRQAAWARRRVGIGEEVPLPSGLLAHRPPPAPLPSVARTSIEESAAQALLASAERLLLGEWELLGASVPTIVDPDWFSDPATGRRAPQDQPAFRIDHRDEEATGNIKVVWELSRHHHLTTLAAAWWLTGDERYAEVVDSQLRSWWQENPFLTGVHWTSGIELGIRLVSWAWIRRLMHDWPKVGDLFEDNPQALNQLWWHQRFLTAFRSHGSSANNHVIAEEVGRVVSACAFPWFEESGDWYDDAAASLCRHLEANTFPSGVNRELASEYHGFVTELGLVAAVEAAAAGRELPVWDLLTRSLDVAASLVDVTGRPPRQGDGDDGRVLVVDAAFGPQQWSGLLDAGSRTIGAADWWPSSPATVVGSLLGALLTEPPRVEGRSSRRLDVFADAGVALLRTPVGERPELWCRCDGGPHGFLSIAAHAHADALALELRCDGVDILADPGTYCYHGEPRWRDYFRSTIGHNTVEVGGRNQSSDAGPFMWRQHAATVVDLAEVGQDRQTQRWDAHHDGYRSKDSGVQHHRRVMMDGSAGLVEVVDTVSGRPGAPLRMAFHLGPQVRARLDGDQAHLSWETPAGLQHAELALAARLEWRAHRGEEEPVLGWYSPSFGVKLPTTVLIGTGTARDSQEMTTTIRFAGVAGRQPGIKPDE